MPILQLSLKNHKKRELPEGSSLVVSTEGSVGFLRKSSFVHDDQFVVAAIEGVFAVACLFVMDEDGRWIGGKFEWISSSRDTREFTNIHDGYNGWSLRDVPNPTEVAFVVFRKDGKKRSNILAATWER